MSEPAEREAPRDGATASAVAARSILERGLFQPGEIPPELGEALRRMERRCRFTEAILEGITSCVLVTDRGGLVTFANRLALETLERSGEDVLGVPLDRILPLERHAQERVEALRPGAELRFELGLEIGGRRRDVGLTAVSAPRPDLPGFARILLFRDLSSGRQHELELRRLHGLNALGHVVGGFAHEVRNPLAAIRSHAELLAAELSPDDPRRESTERILRLVLRMEKLVRTSLRFGQPGEPERADHAVEDLVEEALALVAPRLRAFASKPRLTLAGTLPMVHVDGDQIVEVLRAVLENALDATVSPSQVRVEAAHVPGAGHVRVEVIDSGPGIAPADLSRIFDPFYSTKPRATGLGLAIAQRLVAENGGHLHVASPRGGDTAFAILLPEARS